MFTGGISIQRDNKGWVLIAGNDASDFCSFYVDSKIIEEIIEDINKASVDGAPWAVYEESQR